MKVTVDRKKCLRSGQCIYLHPKLFKEGPDGYPVIQHEGDLPDDLAKEAEDAADVCPSGAIDTVA
jgi:ferredoxin